ncbi:MAG: hypothetical protein IMW98_04940 [Firmicutes bacterium]|nr:hypothetical protein [Bacillota bacterium]
MPAPQGMPRMPRDPDEPELTPERRDEIIDWALQKIQRWGLYTPAIILAESFKPMNFIFGQMAHFAAPYIDILGGGKIGQEIGYLLEDERNIELFIQRVEKAAREENERLQRERPARRRRWWPFGRAKA